ncbi:MAG: GIY-YIG nuclease family protein [Candidatus Dojkabacteria bacterium]
MSFLTTKAPQFQEKVKNAPKIPGCYIYKDKDGGVLYVGKAKNLKNRVNSYFNNYSKLEIRIQQMLDQAEDIELYTVDSEVESIILETNLIKKYKTKYNILMRDDKTYSWVMFEKQIKGVNDYPRIRILRNKDKTDEVAEYFGPYPAQMPLKNILKKVRKVFPYASCNRRLIQITEDPVQVDTNNRIPCLYYHIGLCKAPCASLQNKKDYMRDFNNIKKFFQGEKIDILKELEKNMSLYSHDKDYENAAKVRDKINDIKYVTANMGISNEIDDITVDNLKNIQRENGQKDLIEKLKFPEDKLKNHKDFRIECYDISNIQGTNPVGAMTVMINGEVRPDMYRKFRINSKETPDDFGMLQEMMERRLKYLQTDNGKWITDNRKSNSENSKLKTQNSENDESFSTKPDLIIIDGGKGQLNSVYLILKQYNLHTEIPIVGLAKREEEIFKMTYQFKDEDHVGDEKNLRLQGISKFTRIMLPRKSEALYIVQRIRDEAHRFGITYHRKLRSKKMTLT